MKDERTLQAKLLNQDGLELCTVLAQLRFPVGRCILGPPIGADLDQLRVKGKILKTTAFEMWALTEGRVVTGDHQLLEFAMKLIPNTDSIDFVQRIP